MRRLPIDATGIKFTVAEEPRAQSNFETKRPITNPDGEQLFSVNLLAKSEFEISIIAVKVYGLVDKLAVEEPVKVTGLVAMPWAGSKGSGVSFTAARVEPAAKVKAA